MQFVKPHRVMTAPFLIVVLFAYVFVSPVAGQENSTAPKNLRPFRVDDLFEMESLGLGSFGGSVVLSPDGRSLAFVRQRAAKTIQFIEGTPWFGDLGADVWLQTAPGEKAINITNGISDESQWSAPTWSPDSQRIVMLSSRGHEVNLWVWEKTTGKVSQVTHGGVDTQSERRFRPFIWVTNETILCPMLPDPATREWRYAPDEPRTAQIASSSWARQSRGHDTTVSVLHSGASGVQRDLGPQGKLLLINVVSGQNRVIANYTTWHIALAPGGKFVAYSRLVSRGKMTMDDNIGAEEKHAIEIRSLDGATLIETRSVSSDVWFYSMQWSPDGRELVFGGYDGNTNKESARLFRVNVETRRTEVMDLGPNADPFLSRVGLALPRPGVWLASGNLLVRMAQGNGRLRSAPQARHDWWLVTRNGQRRNLTADFTTPPLEIILQKGGEAFITLADGKLWRFIPEKGIKEDLTRTFSEKAAAILWPNSSPQSVELAVATMVDTGLYYDQIIFSVRKDRDHAPYKLDLKSGAITPLSKPSADALLITYSSASGSAIYTALNRSGRFLWRTDSPSGRSDTVMEVNTFLQGVAESEFKLIDYTSLNGEKLHAWILLPYGYTPGRRYPLITRDYPGNNYVAAVPSGQTLTSTSFLNYQLAAAMGYAVLYPSMPLDVHGSTDDPLLRLTDGVLPAIDKAIEMGIADPDRLLVSGHSYGGYGTYGLVTQTNRFKAAVAMAGLTDLISLYGAFNGASRYKDEAAEDIIQDFYLEAGQMRMGNPPWKDVGRYLRNSPVFYIDRVQTPVMLVQGDMDDVVPIEQAEEFFRGLYRQGKRADFLRYWGEGHNFNNPANIRDLWHRMLAWFDEFGDISRDPQGNLIFEGDRVKSRGGQVPLKPEDFQRLDQARKEQVAR